MVTSAQTSIDTRLPIPQIAADSLARGVVLMRQVVSSARQTRSSGSSGTGNTVLAVLSTGELVGHGSVLAGRGGSIADLGSVGLEGSGTAVSSADTLVARGGVPQLPGSAV